MHDSELSAQFPRSVNETIVQSCFWKSFRLPKNSVLSDLIITVVSCSKANNLVILTSCRGGLSIDFLLPRCSATELSRFCSSMKCFLEMFSFGTTVMGIVSIWQNTCEAILLRYQDLYSGLEVLICRTFESLNQRLDMHSNRFLYF